MKIDLHIHSKYSVDGTLDPRTIIGTAKKNDIDCIAITDHNTIKGGLEARKIAKDIEVIIGSEIMTDICEVSGLYLNEEIKSKLYMDVINEIHSQGGLVVLPHPYRLGDPPSDEFVSKVDFIEGLNARTSVEKNKLACELAHRLGISIVAGSDAHTIMEIGNAYNEIKGFSESKGALIEGDIQIGGKETNQAIKIISTAVGRYKKDGVKGIAKSVKKKLK